MCELLKIDIPKYMHDLVVHASYYSVSRYQRSILVLLKNLNFCEVKSGQLLREISLSDTTLKDCIVPSHNFFTQNEVSASQHFEKSPIKYTGYSQDEELNKRVYFGKFITTYLGDKKFYILIHFDDKLIVLLKNEEFSVHCQYENVEGFRIVDENKSFSASVEINFYGEHNCLITDFESDYNVQLDSDELLEEFEQIDTYKELLSRITASTSELLVHRNITKKDFFELKNTTTFGCNKIRTCSIGEKQMLSKCGDIWWRLTPSDVLVIGIPVVNNSSQRLKPLRNVRPILLSLNDGHQLNYEYSLHKLSVHYKDLKNIETFFESEDNNSSSEIDFNRDWVPVENEILEPESFGVVILKLNIQSLLMADMLRNFLCVIEYEVIDISKSTSIPLQLFVKHFCFQKDLSELESLRLKFIESTIHGDLLSLASTTSYALFKIEFDVGTDDVSVIYQIQKHILSNLNFTICMSENQDAMDVDTNEVQLIFYNKQKNSFWYGSLVRINYTASQAETINLKLYTKKENILLFMKSLCENLNSKTKILKISNPHNTDHDFVMSLKDSLRFEFDKKIEYCKLIENNNGVKYVNTENMIISRHKIIEAELCTDLIIKKNYCHLKNNK